MFPACLRAKHSMFCASYVCQWRPSRRLRRVVALNTVCFVPSAIASGDPLGVNESTVRCASSAFANGDPLFFCGSSCRYTQ